MPKLIHNTQYKVPTTTTAASGVVAMEV